jgi:hypothetical protein
MSKSNDLEGNPELGGKQLHVMSKALLNEPLLQNSGRSPSLLSADWSSCRDCQGHEDLGRLFSIEGINACGTSWF